MMITKNDIQRIGDDFFTVGKIAILQKSIGNDVYDFNFRNFFDCKSVVSSVTDPVILHIGAIEDYAGIDLMLREMGTKLLINENEHLNCSTIERWYPRLKDKTPFTKVYDELPKDGRTMPVYHLVMQLYDKPWHERAKKERPKKNKS